MASRVRKPAAAELVLILIHFNTVYILAVKFEDDMIRINGAVSGFVLSDREGNRCNAGFGSRPGQQIRDSGSAGYQNRGIFLNEKIYQHRRRCKCQRAKG